MSMEIQKATLLSSGQGQGPGPGRRLILFPAPLQGHISPMLHLANILHSKGFNITIIHTNFNSPNVSNYPHFTFRAIDDGLVPNSQESIPDVINLPNLVAKCVDPFRDCLAQLLSEEPVACLIVDALWSYTRVVGDMFDLPLILLWTNSLSTAHVEHNLPLFRNKGYLDLTNKGGQLEASIPEFPTLKFKDIPKILAHNPNFIYEILTNMINEMKGASGIIWNACKELEQHEVPTIYKEFPIKNFIVGPIHKYFPSSSSSLLSHDLSSIQWLNSQAPKSVIYVSFGSMSRIGEAEFLEMAWGLANSMQPFLWVVRPGSVNGSEWMGQLPIGFLDSLNGRGHIVKWAPQQQVLAHPGTGGFLTHNGWNSTLESICEGVPMICAHGILDQPINARYVSDVWKVGVELENGLEREEIKSAIRRLMVDKEGQEMRERVMCLRKTVNQCVEEDGSSHESVESLVDYISSL